jgi:NAD(P) transhydrogenase subunit alpha
MAERDVPQMALGRESEGEVMEAIAIISIFVLAVFVGFEVVSKVSSTLHTPLMSGANAIHGVILVGAIIVADHAETSLELGLSVAAIVLATINMVGGFVVTDRMLEMFKGKGAREKGAESKSAGDKK